MGMELSEAYFDNIFNSFKKAISQRTKQLPAVSLIAIENNTPFAVLVSTIISLRTKDDVTLKASRNILSLADTPQKMVKLDAETIEKAIYPCGFYKRKAQNLINISKDLIARFNGEVPNNQEDLISLEGVGIKTANLTLNLGFNIDAICVDCHVHQIANRLGWISTKTPEESVVELERIMPRRFWIPLNELLVSYGQNICLPISPYCSLCSENDICPKVGVKSFR